MHASFAYVFQHAAKINQINCQRYKHQLAVAAFQLLVTRVFLFCIENRQSLLFVSSRMARFFTIYSICVLMLCALYSVTSIDGQKTGVREESSFGSKVKSNAVQGVNSDSDPIFIEIEDDFDGGGQTDEGNINNSALLEEDEVEDQTLNEEEEGFFAKLKEKAKGGFAAVKQKVKGKEPASKAFLEENEGVLSGENIDPNLDLKSRLAKKHDDSSGHDRLALLEKLENGEEPKSPEDLSKSSRTAESMLQEKEKSDHFMFHQLS